MKNHLLLTLEEVKELQTAHLKNEESRHESTQAAHLSVSSRLESIFSLVEEIERARSNDFEAIETKLDRLLAEMAPSLPRHDLLMMHVQPLNEKVDQLKNEVAALSRVVVYGQPLNEKVDQLKNEVAALSYRLTQLESGLNKQIEFGEELRESVKPLKENFSSDSFCLDYLLANPEVALLMHLRSVLPSNVAVDIGANKGAVSEALLAAGYEVFAFEPIPDVREQLVARLGAHETLHVLPFAVGRENEQKEMRTVSVEKAVEHLFETDLSVYSGLLEHALPEGMRYDRSVGVSVKNLLTLHLESTIPEQVAVLKIDTEGNDLDVIEGMGEARYNVVVCEFWDGKHFFSGGIFGLLKPMILSMRSRGYKHHIVIYRVLNGTSSSEPRFFCNFDYSVENSWGNVFFFDDFEQFRAARNWCQGTLREAQVFG